MKLRDDSLEQVTEADLLNGSFEVPQGVKKIANYAFASCDKFLTRVTLPSSIIEIGQHAFKECFLLEEITLTEDLKTNSSSLKESTLPENLKSIGDFAFRKCKKLIKLNIKSDLSIGEYAFSDCINLQEVNICGKTKIDDYAFANCTSLKQITLSESVTSIGEGAFQNCPSTLSIDIDSTDKINRDHIIQLLPQELQTKVASYGPKQSLQNTIEQESVECDENLALSNSSFWLNALTVTAALGGLGLAIAAIITGSLFLSVAATVCGLVAVGTFFYSSYRKSNEIIEVTFADPLNLNG